ncbi:MAG: hypothetical protein IJX31_03590 [Clostridia bacterium]|nr:hypothetical protein [Clostridia bacterium]
MESKMVEILSGVLFGGLPIALLIGWIAYKIRNPKKIIATCKSCKTKLSPKDVRVKLSEVRWRTESNATSDGRRYSWREYYCVARFMATCPKCSKLRYFDVNLILYSTNTNHVVTLGDVYNDIIREVKLRAPKDFFGKEKPTVIGIDTVLNQLEKLLCD